MGNSINIASLGSGQVTINGRAISFLPDGRLAVDGVIYGPQTGTGQPIDPLQGAVMEGLAARSSPKRLDLDRDGTIRGDLHGDLHVHVPQGSGPVSLTVGGQVVGSIRAEGAVAVRCNSVGGSIRTQGDVSAVNVGGSVKCGGSAHVQNVGGSVRGNQGD